MFRSALLAFALTTFASTTLAQEWAAARLETSPRHLEWVEAEHDGRTIECFLAYPERADKAPAVIVIHEIFGLTDWVRGVADQLAENGYIAIAPDLISGTGPNGGGTEDLGSGDAVRRAIRDLPNDQIDGDLDAAAAFVKSLPACDGTISVAGFCWGGTQSFRYATHNADLKAACVFYGSGPTDVAKINCPVYGFYGENDNRVNSTIDESKRLMAAAGKTYEPVIYDGAGHGFLRAGEDPAGSAENKQAREDAWKRWLKILGE
ncbi:dienelactone hydrolase family protein [Botrimarina mediterranea]|uniref:Carboxymethylenebutenolidase n=1 Tax=Botrimarina mediterranea TaxID=2528022 RepID=A0A518K5V8_9BACT|nr:dienelactone hydrolase family protein [Botrimarina mediterranea]QDV73165.1 Carboxymethylenebutenolidase [Botrimarina mediterranea]